MILLDTSVLIEPLRREPQQNVIDWIDAQPLEKLFLSAITVAELRAGIARLPAGKRRAVLQESLETRLLPLFAARILPFDRGCSQAYASLMARITATGQVMSAADGYIAAIAATNGFAIATRNTEVFKAAGIAVLDPWQE